MPIDSPSSPPVPRPLPLLTAGLLALMTLASPDVARPEDPVNSQTQVEFFEKKVRPLLVANCYECHGAQKQQGGLRLDSKQGWTKGGDSGPAIVPGQPDQSLLIEAVRYESFEMPPKGQLSSAEIEVLVRWIADGAADPREHPIAQAAEGRHLDIQRLQSEHWAYRPPGRTAPPEVANVTWPRGIVDRFVLARLEQAELQPRGQADRRTLVRRLYFDLLGLPPSPEQIEAFVRDPRQDAYERLVDQLLASPHFGERWGRHWLDVVRYADSVTLRGFVFPEAWRYRDYVIDAWNQDLPYDQFLQQQLAGDLLPADGWSDQQRKMVATTFLMLGNTNLEDQDKKQLDMDFVDEQIDVMGKALLAQTIACARCHDHKFDPIPTSDYYAIAGILSSVTSMEHANVSKWVELPLPVAKQRQQVIEQHQQQVAELDKRVKDAKKQLAKLTDAESASGKIVLADQLPGIVVDSASAVQVGTWQLSQYASPYVGDGYLHDQAEGKGSKTLTFHPELPMSGRYEVRLAYTPGTNRETATPVTILHADGESVVRVDQRKAPPIDKLFVSLGEFRFERGNQGYVMVSNEDTQGHVIADAIQLLRLDDPNRAETAKKDAVDLEASAEAQQLMREVQQLEAEMKQLVAKAPEQPRVMTVRDNGQGRDIAVHIRGSVHNLGDVVPRGFLSVATYDEPPAIGDNESGRLQLARWISSPTNPLTARAIVNRVWHWLMGAGLVTTPDNFGTTGDTPSHPELLDDLAVRFVDQGWSLKWLVREIVVSQTYRMSTDVDPEALAVDPENRLLWRANRQRLEAEALRDSMLLAAGSLDGAIGGPRFPNNLASDYGYHHQRPCRSVYVPVFRNALPDIYAVFDFPDASLVAGRRNVSTVAPQALFFMNNPFVIEQSRQTASRLLQQADMTDEMLVERIYAELLGREATADERRIALDFLSQAQGPDDRDRLAACAALVQAVFASPDFRYVD